MSKNICPFCGEEITICRDNPHKGERYIILVEPQSALGKEYQRGDSAQKYHAKCLMDIVNQDSDQRDGIISLTTIMRGDVRRSDDDNTHNFIVEESHLPPEDSNTE